MSQTHESLCLETPKIQEAPAVNPRCESMMWEGDWLAAVACAQGNAAALQALPQPGAAEQTPLHAWQTWGKGRGEPEAQTAAMREAQVYEEALAERQAARAARAAADRAEGLSTVDTHEDDLYTRVHGAIDAFAHIPLPGGGDMAAPYHLNTRTMQGAPQTPAEIAASSGGFREYGLRGATKVPVPEGAEGATRKAQIGRGSPEELEAVLGGLAANPDLEGMTSPVPGDDPHRRYAEKKRKIMPDGAAVDPQIAAAAHGHAAAQTAGLGVDCAGFVLQAQGNAGLAEPSVAEARSKGVQGVMKEGAPIGGRRRDGSVDRSPLGEDGSLRLRPGDAMQIANAIGPAGHIAIVEQVEDLGDEVVVQYAHATDEQAVIHGQKTVGNRPEGVRRDLVVYDKRTGAWRTVRGAYTSTDLNNNRIQGFSRPTDHTGEAP